MLINRLQEKIGHHVSVIALFDSPTIAGLAHYLGEACPDVVRRVFGPESLSAEPAPDAQFAIRRGRRATHRPKPRELLVALQPEGSRTPWFMVHPPGGIVVCYQALSQRLGRERPFYGIRSRGLHGEPDLPGRLEEMAARVRGRHPRGPAARTLPPRRAGPPGDWSPSRWPSNCWSQGESISMLALLDTSPETADDPNWADKPGMEYGLDLSLEELARLGPDEQLPFLWQHALRLGLIESSVPMQVAHQVLDDLKRIFHHHMVLTDRYVVRPYAGPDHPDPPVRCAVRGLDSHTTEAGEDWRPASTSTSFPASITAWSRNRTSRISPGHWTRACVRSIPRDAGIAVALLLADHRRGCINLQGQVGGGTTSASTLMMFSQNP